MKVNVGNLALRDPIQKESVARKSSLVPCQREVRRLNGRAIAFVPQRLHPPIQSQQPSGEPALKRGQVARLLRRARQNRKAIAFCAGVIEDDKQRLFGRIVLALGSCRRKGGRVDKETNDGHAVHRRASHRCVAIWDAPRETKASVSATTM